MKKDPSVEFNSPSVRFWLLKPSWNALSVMGIELRIIVGCSGTKVVEVSPPVSFTRSD